MTTDNFNKPIQLIVSNDVKLQARPRLADRTIEKTGHFGDFLLTCIINFLHVNNAFKCSSPVCPGCALGSSPRWARPDHLPSETTGRQPNQMPEPSQLAPLDMKKQWFCSAILTHFLRLRRKLISSACIRNHVLSVTTQSS